jgi:hypothetical protein
MQTQYPEIEDNEYLDARQCAAEVTSARRACKSHYVFANPPSDLIERIRFDKISVSRRSRRG